jgi:hypothetical protein
MLSSEFFDSVDAFRDRARHPVAPRLVGFTNPSLRDHPLDRRHVLSLTTTVRTTQSSTAKR